MARRKKPAPPQSPAPVAQLAHRCERCDRVECPTLDRAEDHSPGCQGCLDADRDCAAHAVDWRARAIAAEARIAALESAIRAVIDPPSGSTQEFVAMVAARVLIDGDGPVTP